MPSRPISITIISWLFIAVGIISIGADLLPLVGINISAGPTDFQTLGFFELSLMLFVRLLALVCGVFMLYGFNWARWLLIVWMGFHIVISITDSPVKLIIHILIFSIILFFLFRPKASIYFRSRKTKKS
jgi:hypothetical protein